MLNRRFLGVALAFAILGSAISFAAAQDYPNRAVRIMIGPSSDVTARLMADRLHAAMGQPVIVENRPGGGGEVAAKTVAAAEPDGHTLLYATSSYTLSTALHLATYDFVKEFEPVALFGISSFTLVVHPSVQAKNLQELIALAKEKPGQLNCASSGLGTPPHLGCEMLNAMAGIRLVHVPFRNVNEAVNSLLGGHVQMLFSVSINARAAVQSGALRAIAITTPKQSGLMPNVPTMEESGLPGFIITGWGAIVAPAGTPAAVTGRLSKEIQTLLRDPVVSDRIVQSGQEPSGVETPQQFREFIKSDIDRWNRLIDLTGVKRGKSEAK